MGLFNFGKKNNEEEEAEKAAAEAAAREAEENPVHDAVGGDRGPFAGDEVEIDDFDFTDFASGILNLGSMRIPMPKDSQLQVEMGDEGPRALHIVTEWGRLTPVAFAAPRTPGQWPSTVDEIALSMRQEGLATRLDRGPWGKEVVGTAEAAIVRVIGVDGPRWMLRMTVAAPTEYADKAAALGREVVARTFVYRGDDPMPAGTSLPVAVPAELADQIRGAWEERNRQMAEQAEAQAENETETN